MKELVLINENRFYVYEHRKLSDDSLVYIGHGTKDRVKDRKSRNKAWKEIANNDRLYFTIIKENMTKFDAEDLEVRLINICNPVANFHKGTLEAKPLDKEEISSKFYYDETSPSGLRYKKHNGQGGMNERKAGDVAGHIRLKTNYASYVVNVSKRNVYAHRAIWYLCTGFDPIDCGTVVDHIDGNPCNNNISNLRVVSTAENARNVVTSKESNTGYKGVTFSDNMYVSHWRYNFKPLTKTFSCATYGNELAIALAVEHRHLEITKQNKEGASYTERHTGSYKRHKALLPFTECEILEMLERDVRSDNTSGSTGVSKNVRGDGGFWMFRKRGEKTRRFSIVKYGDDLANNLAKEYSRRVNGEQHCAVSGYNLEETSAMLSDSNWSSTSSGITGLSFTSTAKSGVVVVVNKMLNNRKLIKHFRIAKLGLLEAIAEAIRWRNSLVA